MKNYYETVLELTIYFRDLFIGLKWTYLIENEVTKNTNGDWRQIFSMDSVFFHDDRFEVSLNENLSVGRYIINQLPILCIYDRTVHISK